MELQFAAFVVSCLVLCFSCRFEVVSACNDTGGYILDERHLLKCLMADYNPDVRPALKPNDVINVTLDSIIGTVIELDEKTNVLTTDLWLTQKWNDPQLTWSPAMFGDLREIQLPIDKIWTPNIVLYNNVDDAMTYVTDRLAIVNSSGDVTWMPHGRLRSRCQLDLAHFPFDTQHCSLVFGSRSYDRSLVVLNVTPSTTEQREFLRNTFEWDVDGFRGHLDHPIMRGVTPYSTVAFTFTLRRTSLYFKYMLVGPSVILTVLTLALYWIPIQSGQRFMLASGILVSATMLLSVLEGYLPTDIGKLPLIASYICYNMVFLVITILISAVVFNCHHRDCKRSPVPPVLRSVFLGMLGKMCCVSTRPYTTLASSGHIVAHRELEERSGGAAEGQDYAPDAGRQHPDKHRSLGGRILQQDAVTNALPLAVEQTLDEIRRYLRVLAMASEAAAVESKDQLHDGSIASHRDLVVNEWQRIALVIDRLSFGFFLIVSIIVTISLYAR